MFDDNKTFTEWFGNFLGTAMEDNEDSLISKEKRLVVIHRLHQILEPFMLRRMVRRGLIAFYELP